MVVMNSRSIILTPIPLQCHFTILSYFTCNAYYLSICSHLLSLPCQSFKYAWGKLISDETSEDHEVLGLLEQLLCKSTTSWIFELTTEKNLTVAAAAADAPQEHIPNIASDLRRKGGEVVGRIAYL